MKLVYPNIDTQLNFDKSGCSLIVENSQMYFKLCTELIGQCSGGEGNFVLSDNNVILQIDKVCEVLFDYFNLTLNSKKTNNLLLKTLGEIVMHGDYTKELTDINGDIIKFNDKLLSQTDLPVVCGDEIEFENLLKMSNYKFNESIDITNKIADYVEIMLKLKSFNIIILINSFCILSEDEIKSIIKQFEYMNIKIFFVDPIQKYKFDNCQSIVIDNDLCEI